MPAFVDRTGQRFGRLFVLKLEGRSPTRWRVRCECGAEKTVRAQTLIRISSCGCFGTESRVNDLTGREFGRWTVVARSGLATDHTAKWLCRCSCGTEKVVHGTSLKKRSSRSCGCLQKEAVTDHYEQLSAERALEREAEEWDA